MANEWLVIFGGLALFFALIEAWMLVVTSANPDGKLARLIPGWHDLLRSHIDYLMMSLFLFVFYMLFSHFSIKAHALVLLAMAIGSIGNAGLFMVRAIAPGLKEQPTVAFQIVMTISCSLTTIGYLSGIFLVVRAALQLV